MATYVLAGGNDSDYPEFGTRLANFVISHVSSPKILDVFFAVDESKHDDKVAMWQDWYNQYFGANIERRNATTATFEQDVEWADVIYFHGGQTALLMEVMKGYTAEQLRLLFGSKIVVGSSAGANFLSLTNYSLTAREIMPGKGVVSCAAVVHYLVKDFDGSVYSLDDWRSIVDQIKDKADGLPTLLLPEGTFSVVEQ